MRGNTWTDQQDVEGLAVAFARHTGTLRGALRQQLVTRAVLNHLSASPTRVLDVGGGAGLQACALAEHGHQVTILDPDPNMLGQAQTRVQSQPPEIRERVVLVEGRGEDAQVLVGAGFDAVLCHGVLMYVDDASDLLQALAATAKPGGLISVLSKNAAALGMRPALEGRHEDALRALADVREVGNLGVASRGDSLDQVSERLCALGCELEAWYGVRIFTDHLGNAPVGSDFGTILELEWQAGQRDPYRGVGRLFHLIARKLDR